MTKFGTVIGITKYSPWMVHICPKQIQDGGRPPSLKIERWQYFRRRLIDLDKFGTVMCLGPLDSASQ